MIFIDTAYFVAVAVPADGLHQAAIEWSTAVSAPFLTTEFVLLEFVNLLSSKKLRARAHTAMSSIYADDEIQVVPATADWFQRGLKLHAARPDKSWSLTNCISFEVMREENVTDAPIYDQDFEQAGFRALLRDAPPA